MQLQLRAARYAPVIRSFLLTSRPRFGSAAIAEAESEEDLEGRTTVQTATRKIESLIASAPDRRRDVEDPQLQTLIPLVRNGTLSTAELLRGVQERKMTQRDLQFFVDQGVLSPLAQQHIRTVLHQGTSQLSVVEVMELLRNNLLGQKDLTLIVQSGDLGLEEIEYLVEKEMIPRDVADAVTKEIQEKTSPAPERPFSFASDHQEYWIRGLLASSDFLWTRLGPYVLTGNLHPSDLSLLVSENLIREQDAESILDSCASDVLETYKEAEKFAELVGNGRFTYEELEVMRAKGVLGDALVHYLVTRNALGDEKAQRLLEVEEDVNYYDPEVTDDEEETRVLKYNYAPKRKENGLMANVPSQSILEKGGASDEGFYPKELNQNDTFSLWEYLSEVYEHRPGKGELLDLIQEVHRSVGLRQLPKTQQPLEEDKPVHEAEIDADRDVLAVGKRKCSVASVVLRKGTGQIIINNKSLQEYFPNMDGRCYVLSPFLATDTLGQFDATVTVGGGGWSGQSQAVRHGIARALKTYSTEYQESLKESGLLKRDPRIVERKKPGRAKARKSFQWVKR